MSSINNISPSLQTHWTANAEIELERDLRLWTEEVRGTPEHGKRQDASRRIINCERYREKSLDLKSLGLTTLPDTIDNLGALETLYLFGNRLKTLPDTIGNLRALKNLCARANRLTTLPDTIGNLEALETLYLGANQLTTLPNTIGNLRALKDLNLSANRLTMLPDTIGNLEALEKLDLSANQLTTLPDTIGNLGTLQELDLSANHLTTLPDTIGNLGTLQELYVRANHLTTLPDTIGNLAALERLYLGGNQLTTLPDTIGNLRALQELYLNANQLTTLPLALVQQLSSCCTIGAERNRFSPVAIRALLDAIAETQRLNPLLGPRFHVSIHDITAPTEFISLEENMTFWLKKFQIIFPKISNEAHWVNRDPNRYPSEENTSKFLSFYKTLSDLDARQKNNLNEFLRRLKDTKDYKSDRTQANIVLRVDRMLEGASTNPEFLGQMNTIVEGALATCSDRVTEAFDQIEIAWKVLCNAQNLNEPELADLVIGLDRLDRLNKITYQKIEEKGLGDAIETILYYRIQLAIALKLPISTEGMLYPSMSGITPEELVDAREKIIAETGSQDQQIEILCLSDLWKNEIRKKNSAAFEQLMEEIEAILSSDRNEDDKKIAIAELTNEKMKALTRSALFGNPS